MSENNGDSAEPETETLQGVRMVDPANCMALAANLEIKAPDHPTAIMERQVVLIFEDRSGTQYVIPMTSVAGTEVAMQLRDAASEASGVIDADELETVELAFGTGGKR